MSLFGAIVKSFVKNVGNFASGLVGVPIAGSILVDAWGYWQKETDDSQRKAELENYARRRMDKAVVEALAVVQQEAPQLPADRRAAIVQYLSQVPASIRRSLRRPADHTGTTVPPGLALRSAHDLLPFLPPKLPRFKPGDQPLSDLELVELLGQGGFGEVWKARHLDRPTLPPVALKFCLDADAARSLERERDLLDHVASAGKHNGIVQLLYTHLRANPPCLEYEYVEGGDLAGVLAELHANGLPSAELVAKVILNLAKIVAFAHGQSPAIVHRDLKPANILVRRRDGKLAFKITDFGIGGLSAKEALHKLHTGQSKPSERQLDTILGAYTPLYASPEQMRGDAPEPRDDVHALGIIWFQLQTGLLALMSLPSDWRDDLVDAKMPGPLLDLLASCIGRQARRPTDAGDLAKRLATALAGGTGGSTTTSLPEKKTAGEGTGPASSVTGRGTPIAGEPDRQMAISSAFKQPCPSCQALVLVKDAGMIGKKIDCPKCYYRFVVEEPADNGAMAAKPKDKTPAPPSKGAKGEDRGGGDDTTTGLPASYAISQVDITMRLIPAGRFWMGSAADEEGRSDDETLHEVLLTKPYYLAGHPVTRGQFRSFVEADNYRTQGDWMNAGFKQDDDHPVVGVSHNDAVAYCNWLSQFTGQTYGLPTEAQWEYACRGRAISLGGVEITSDPYHFGKTITAKNANFSDSEIAGTTKVGAYAANGFGLCDMHGNVWEWCADWYGEYSTSESDNTDPQGPATGTGRVLRGGSFFDYARNCRSAYRDVDLPGGRDDDNGFRVVCRVPSGA